MNRKITSLALVGVLCLAFATPAFADRFRGRGQGGFHHHHHRHHGFHRFGPFVVGGLVLGGALAAPYYYSYPYAYPGYAAPGYYPYAHPGYAAPVYAPAPAYAAPSVQREVCYDGGCYRLRGDGVTVAYQWVWLPYAPPPPPRTAAIGPVGPMGPQGPPGPAGVASVTRWSKFKDILFDFDKSDLRSNETGKVSEIVAYLKDNPGTVIGIDGYADPRGSDQYNQALSERRVSAVRDALVNAGVPADRITTGAFGEMRLKCHVPTQECWQSDRRVEVLINAK